VVALRVDYYRAANGRAPAQEALDGLPPAVAAYVVADIEMFGKHERKAPVQWKVIRGHKPMLELRTGGYRTFVVGHRGVLWVLGVAKKQNQDREIAACEPHMQRVLGS
jgi:hypothetical protein